MLSAGDPAELVGIAGVLEEVFADLVVIGSQRVGIWEGGIAVHRVDKPGLEAWALHGNGLRIAQAEHVQREYQLRQVKEAGCVRFYYLTASAIFS